MVVCPIYQLPTRSSQIYLQALTQNVCIFTFSHLSVLVKFTDRKGQNNAQALLHAILTCAEEMNPTKDAADYWKSLNRTMLGFDKVVGAIWAAEKLATVEAIRLAKEEALTTLAKERERIMKMSREEAITKIIRDRNIMGRERVIGAVADNGIFAIE